LSVLSPAERKQLLELLGKVQGNLKAMNAAEAEA